MFMACFFNLKMMCHCVSAMILYHVLFRVQCYLSQSFHGGLSCDWLHHDEVCMYCIFLWLYIPGGSCLWQVQLH